MTFHMFHVFFNGNPDVLFLSPLRQLQTHHFFSLLMAAQFGIAETAENIFWHLYEWSNYRKMNEHDRFTGLPVYPRP